MLGFPLVVQPGCLHGYSRVCGVSRVVLAHCSPGHLELLELLDALRQGGVAPAWQPSSGSAWLMACVTQLSVNACSQQPVHMRGDVPTVGFQDLRQVP